MAETAGAVPATMPGPFRGRAPGKSETLYHRFGAGQPKACGFSDFRTAANSGRVTRPPLVRSLGGDRTDGNGVAVQGAGYGGILACLLVERGQSRLVSGAQNIDFLAHYQGKLGAFGDASAGAICGRALHVLSAAHGVTDLAGEALLASGEGVDAEQYAR